jgi:hypothetical protein
MPHYDVVSLYYLAERFLFRVYHAIADGDTGATNEFVYIDDFASDRCLVDSYQRAVARFREIGVLDDVRDSEESFAHNVGAALGARISVRESTRGLVLIIRHAEGADAKLVAIRHDAQGRQARQSTQMVPVEDESVFADAVRRAASFALTPDE